MQKMYFWTYFPVKMTSLLSYILINDDEMQCESKFNGDTTSVEFSYWKYGSRPLIDDSYGSVHSTNQGTCQEWWYI